MSANAEIIAELRRVLNERDEARAALAKCPDCAMWAERSARWHEDMQRAERERDEAIACFGNVEAKLNAVRVALDRACGESREAQWDRVTALARERDEARAEVERLRETKDYLRTWLSSEELEGLRVKAAEHPLLWEEIHHLKDEVKRLREALEASGEP